MISKNNHHRLRLRFREIQYVESECCICASNKLCSKVLPTLVLIVDGDKKFLRQSLDREGLLKFGVAQRNLVIYVVEDDNSLGFVALFKHDITHWQTIIQSIFDVFGVERIVDMRKNQRFELRLSDLRNWPDELELFRTGTRFDNCIIIL